MSLRRVQETAQLTLCNCLPLSLSSVWLTVKCEQLQVNSQHPSDGPVLSAGGCSLLERAGVATGQAVTSQLSPLLRPQC